MNKSINLLLSSWLFLGAITDATSTTIREDVVKDGFEPVNTVHKPYTLGLCESDCDIEMDCIKGLKCAEQYRNTLQRMGLNKRTANCYNANTPNNYEVCFDPTILNTAGAGGGKFNFLLYQRVLGVFSLKTFYLPKKIESRFPIKDPHFRTYDNTMYSFHGQCDLVMATSPSFDNGLGFDLHIRTEIVDGSWSLISNAALRVGDDIFEIVNDQSHYYNGIKDVELPIMMADKYRVSVVVEDVTTANEHGIEITEKQFTYSVDLVNQNAVTIQNYRHMISVNVGTYLHDTHGMLGYRNGKKGMIGRDGETVLVDPNEMGLQWQVRDYERMLFHNVKGVQYPELCTIPVPAVTTTTNQRRRRLRQTEISLDDAKIACQSVSVNMIEFCIEDIIRTGDIRLAHGYMGAAW